MSQEIAKKQTKPALSAKKDKSNNNENALPVGVAGLTDDLKTLISQTKEEEIANNESCEKIVDKVIGGLQSKLLQANIDEKEAQRLIEDAKAERERLFQLNTDVRQTNDKRLKLFLDYVFKSVQIAGGLVALKIILDFVRELIFPSAKK